MNKHVQNERVMNAVNIVINDLLSHNYPYVVSKIAVPPQDTVESQSRGNPAGNGVIREISIRSC